MNMLSQEEINNIRSNVDIIDVISSYIPLTPKGKNYFGKCPFHDDHAPSMSVSHEKQIYTCFSCGATGNVFKFVMDYENVSFPESINIVASKAGLNVHVNTNSKPDKYSELYKIYEISNKIYQNNINTAVGKSAKDYLLSREISNEAIKEFEIGLASKNHNLITDLLHKKNFSYEDLIRSGLVVKNEFGYHDIYYNRIMFPIWDVSGKIVGYSGRVYNGEDSFKYINTKETEIFKKGDLLYNYHRSKEYARASDTIIIMEGQIDVIRAYSVGIKNVIGTMGTAITKKHAALINRLARNVILCFDGDDAGGKATLSCSRELTKTGITPKVVRLPDKMDPDEYIKKYGKEKFENVLENAMSLMDFKLSYYKKNKDFTDPTDVSNYVKDMITELNSIDDDILRELTIKKISDESNLDIKFLKGQLNSVKDAPKIIKDKPSEIKAVPKTKYEKAEESLIFYMLKSPEVINMYDKKITFMPDNKYRFLAREISYFYKKYGVINEADFISFISDDENLLKTLGSVMSLSLKDNYSCDEIDDYIGVIRDYSIKVEVNRLKGLMHAETDPLAQANIALKIVELKVGRKEND